MRVKPVPEPADSLDTVAEAQRAVPLVPGSEADCCALLMDRIDLGARDAARTWLTFLRGVDLVRETDRGFVRTAAAPTRSTLAAGLESGVLGARELQAALGDDPLTVAAGFAAVRELVPRWERDRDPTWEDAWRARTERLLGWLVLAGLAERVEGGYVRP